MMQPKRGKSQNTKTSERPTAVSRLKRYVSLVRTAGFLQLVYKNSI